MQKVNWLEQIGVTITVKEYSVDKFPLLIFGVKNDMVSVIASIIFACKYKDRHIYKHLAENVTITRTEDVKKYHIDISEYSYIYVISPYDFDLT